MTTIRSWNSREDGPLRELPAYRSRPHVLPKPAPIIDAEFVSHKLERAGMTLLSIHDKSPFPRGFQTAWPEFARTLIEAYGYSGVRLKTPVPSAMEISEMDTVFSWLTLIPNDRFVLRRIVAARALVSPINQRHLYSWRRLANLLGCDRRAVTRWWEQGIALIVKGLEPTKVRSDNYPLTPCTIPGHTS